MGKTASISVVTGQDGASLASALLKKGCAVESAPLREVYNTVSQSFVRASQVGAAESGNGEPITKMIDVDLRRVSGN